MLACRKGGSGTEDTMDYFDKIPPSGADADDVADEALVAEWRSLGYIEQDIENMTPGERMEVMWELTMKAWHIDPGDAEARRVRRDIVRVIRNGKYVN